MSFLFLWNRKFRSFLFFNSRALFDAIEKFSDFYIKGFSPIVYQSVEFLRLKEWISNCENFEPPHLRIEPEPNAIPDDYIEQCLKSNSELEAAYEKLLSLRNEQSLLSKHIDFCVLGSVEEYAQKDRADVSLKQFQIPFNSVIQSDNNFLIAASSGIGTSTTKLSAGCNFARK